MVSTKKLFFSEQTSIFMEIVDDSFALHNLYFSCMFMQ